MPSSSTMTLSPQPISVKPISVASSDLDFGALIENVDIENLTGSTPWNGNLSNNDFALIRDTLYKSDVVVLKNQASSSPKAQYELTHRFDPTATAGYGHGQTLDAKRSILHPDLKTVPHQPEVQIIGNGHVPEYEGLSNLTLVHPHHRKFHKHPIPEQDDLTHTRFYRWHIDAALYGALLHPPKVTSLLAVSVPKGRRQTLRYDDGTGDELDVPLGTTAFVSGYKMYDLLSAQDKEFARTSRIEYAPHPYIWMSAAKSMPDGLGLYSDDLELSPSDLPPIVSTNDIQILPMTWKNPLTGRLALQMHPSAVRKIHLANGDVIDDLKTVRETVHRLQRPGIAPRLVYAHDWEEGDMVLFNNWGVLHSVVGAFGKDEVRLFRQCNLAASEGPV